MTPASPQIRRAEPADAPALARFAARIFAETFGPDNRPEDTAAHVARSFGPAHQARELADPDFVTLVVDGSDGLAAYAQVRRTTAPPCVTTDAPVELYRFYVDRPWHGRGLAQRLMEAVHGAASALGGRSVWLSVWERNPRGIAFYTKCGYRDVGGAIFMLGTDPQNDRVLVVPVTVHGLKGVRPNGDDT
ncbi:MAG TPA: GNAT family N-acetyltransferase [Gemmatimonadales bacterium]|nr:GNAT family N-acetyltransferase [Gemmatimonadales bacterium]HRZ08537.1 GNAT family N-acetyltransferase [Gemmatimonadales bacterium]